MKKIIHLGMHGSFHIDRLFLLIFSIVFLIPGSLYSQTGPDRVWQADTIESSLDFFGEDASMNITLTFDIKKFQRERYKEEYMPVHFHYQLNDSLSLERELRLKARGETRKKHCSLAPFWLEFRRTDLENKASGDINRVKIVTHCKGSKAYEKYVLKEYLCYKIYNIISPYSFRVRLVRITYVDTGRDNEVSEGWAFMIEPVGLLAQRLNAMETEKEGLLSRNMRPVEMNRMALFQYMIGNPDYSVPHGHNVKILSTPGYGNASYTAVPYDFDYSGLVNASYAVPSEYLDISSVRERYYLGPCRPDVDIGFAIEQLNLHREEILQLVWEFKYLEPKEKKGVVSYLEEYFDQAAHPKALIFGIQKTCL